MLISEHIVMLFLESSYSIIALIFFLSSFFAEFVEKYSKGLGTIKKA